MMKQEFEDLIGKRVEYSVFKMYEQMYMAVDLTKQDFVKLLDIKVIPEDPQVVRARRENELRLLELKLQLEALIEERDRYMSLYKENSRLGLSILASSNKYDLERCNNAIRELRWFIRISK